jgi:hypothetical protein
MTGLLERGADEAAIFRDGRALLAGLIAQDGWLPAALLEPDPDNYRIHQLHVDPAGRFSVSAMVWGPGQGTPIHDHTVWGMVGVLRGRERCEEFAPCSSRAARWYTATSTSWRRVISISYHPRLVIYIAYRMRCRRCFRQHPRVRRRYRHDPAFALRRGRQGHAFRQPLRVLPAARSGKRAS